jgi:putative transposase
MGFTTIAACYVIHKGRTFTVALTWVRKGTALEHIVKRLLPIASRQAGICLRLLLLDRGFYTVNVIRYLQAARAA